MYNLMLYLDTNLRIFLDTSILILGLGRGHFDPLIIFILNCNLLELELMTLHFIIIFLRDFHHIFYKSVDV